MRRPGCSRSCPCSCSCSCSLFSLFGFLAVSGCGSRAACWCWCWPGGAHSGEAGDRALERAAQGAGVRDVPGGRRGQGQHGRARRRAGHPRRARLLGLGPCVAACFSLFFLSLTHSLSCPSYRHARHRRAPVLASLNPTRTTSAEDARGVLPLHGRARGTSSSPLLSSLHTRLALTLPTPPTPLPTRSHPHSLICTLAHAGRGPARARVRAACGHDLARDEAAGPRAGARVCAAHPRAVPGQVARVQPQPELQLVRAGLLGCVFPSPLPSPFSLLPPLSHPQLGARVCVRADGDG